MYLSCLGFTFTVTKQTIALSLRTKTSRLPVQYTGLRPSGAAHRATPPSAVYKPSVAMNMPHPWEHNQWRPHSQVTDSTMSDSGGSSADGSTLPAVPSGSVPPSLAPSVEAAYKMKCIALKKRKAEVDEANNATRVNIAREKRNIRKLRLERAIMLERLSEIINKNGMDVQGLGAMFDDNSEGSSDEPPTQPHEKPLRSKRPHRRPVLSPPPALALSSSTHLTPRGHRHNPYESAYASNVREDPYARTLARPSSGLTNGHPSSHQPSAYEVNPNEPPPDAFTTFLNSIRHHNDFHGLSEGEQLNKARESWQHLPPTEYERMDREYQQRLVDWEAAGKAVHEEEETGAGGIKAKGEGEGGDEEMEEAGKGGFTAVNG